MNDDADDGVSTMGYVRTSAIIYWALVVFGTLAGGLVFLGACKGGLYPHADTARGGRGTPHRVVSPATAVMLWQMPPMAFAFLTLGVFGWWFALVGLTLGIMYAAFIYQFASTAPESITL